MNAVCRDCSATIRFVKLDTGKSIPVEPIATHNRGTVAAKFVDGRLVGYFISKAKPLRGGYLRYRPHMATCKPDKPRVTAADRTPALF